MADKSSFSLGGSRATTIKNVAAATVADAAATDASPDEQVVLSEIEAFISGLPTLYRTGILLVLTGFELLPCATRLRRRFSRLTRAEQTSFLRFLERSRFYPYRAASLAIKCMIVVNYFAQPEVEKALGYDSKCLVEHTEGGGR